MKSRLRELRGRAWLGLAAAGVLALGVANPALADTSSASARAARLQLLNQTALDTGTVSATNPGTGEVKTGDTTPALSLLGSQTLLSAGVLAQDAVAGSDGTSAACAGAVGAGGSIQIGPSGACTATIGTPGGVVLQLGIETITADAIYASCTASSDGTVTGTATIVNATGAGIVPLTLPLSPQPNQGVTVPGLASLILNEQTTGTGTITVSALHVTLLGDAADLTIGTVTCGPNAITEPIPTIPLRGLPLAFAIVGVAGGVWWMRRRRTAAVAHA